MEEGLDVERVTVARNDVDKDTMSAMVKLAKKICGFCDVGQSTAESQLMTPSERTAGYTRRAPTRAGRSRRHRGACLRRGVADDVFPRQARQVVESNALLFSLGRLRGLVSW